MLYKLTGAIVKGGTPVLGAQSVTIFYMYVADDVALIHANLHIHFALSPTTFTVPMHK